MDSGWLYLQVSSGCQSHANTITMLRFSVTVALTIISVLCLKAQEYLEILDSQELTYEQIVDAAEKHFDDKGRGKHTGYKQFLRWKYWAHRNLDDRGFVIGDTRTSEAFEAFRSKNIPVFTRNASNWQQLGPLSAVNTSTWSSHIGRLTNLAIDPNDSNHLLVTSPGGGAWRSTDEGLNWEPVFDDQSTLVCYAAMISSANSDHYLVSTAGSGTYRSLDQGQTWTQVSGIGNDRVYAFLQDPINASVLLAVSRNGRVYRSTDSGVTWSISIDLSGELFDIEFKPGNSSMVYVSGSSGKVYKSTNNGLSFTQVSGPWENRSIMMTVTPHNPDILYVLQERSGGFGGLFLSRDEGSSWETMSTYQTVGNIMGYDLSEGGGQAPRDMDVIVNPLDSTEVIVAGIMSFRSTNKGVTWTHMTHWLLGNSVPFAHADIDQLLYKNGKIYIASDGGLFISPDGGGTFIDRTTGLGIRQFYRIGAATTVAERINGGSQDNGTGVYKDGLWYDWLGADGMESVIMDQDADILFGSIQFGSLRKSLNGGQSISGVSQTQSGENGNWVTPLEKDPIKPSTIYQGKKHLYKSTNLGSSWSQISDDNPGSGNSRLDEVAIAPSDNHRIYMSYGSILLTTSDGGNTWATITPAGTSWINYIQVHPQDPLRVLLTLNGGQKVRESVDGGMSWSDMTGNLPGIGANCAIYDGKGIGGTYVGMNRGIYYRDDNAPTWTLVSMGVPNAEVTELEIVGNKLYAATYGRGLWMADITGSACHINALAEVSSCNNQGTVDLSDDTYTITLRSNGLDLGGSFSVSGGVSVSNLSYNDDHFLDNNGAGYLVSNGPVTVTVSDDGSSGCNKTITLHPPSDCEANNTCIAADTITQTGTYTADPIEGGDGATQNNATHSEWYVFIPQVDGTITIRSCGYGVDTRLHIHEGACGSFVSTTSFDDQCEMSNGSSAYASEAIDYNVVGGTPYYIEWDDRWSASGFEWDFDYNPSINLDECAEQVHAYLDNLPSATYRASDFVLLSGTADNSLTAKSPGGIKVGDTFVAGPGVNITIARDSCFVNDTLDWEIIGGGGLSLTDFDTTSVPLAVPLDLPFDITDLDIEIDLSHTYIGDLEIWVVNPTLDSILLWDRYCGGENDLHFKVDEQADNISLCGDAWRQGDAVRSAGSVPVNPMAAWLGQSAVGEWRLVFYDAASGDQGTVERVSLHFKAQP